MNCNVVDYCKLYKDNSCIYDNSFCMRKYKINYLLNQSLLSEDQKKEKSLVLDIDQSDLNSYSYLNNVKNNIVNFVNEGNNLYIYSQIPGNGKTSWATKLIRAYIYKIWPESKLTCRTLFINVPKFLISLKASISNQSDYIDHINEFINSADIVVWDDIGTKSATEFEHEHLLILIDSRLLDNKTNIFTSNIIPNELSSLIGDRLASRIINTSKTIEFVGADKRGVNVE